MLARWNGSRYKPRRMATIRVDNPADGTIAAEVESLDASEIDELCHRSREAAGLLCAMPLTERLEICDRFLESFASRAETIARDVTVQMGKPIVQSRAEVRTAVDRARYMMQIAPEMLADIQLPAVPGFERSIERVPVGVVLDIAAWNYPLLIPVNVVVPAFLAGNAVMLKHSSRTPLCARHFADAFADAGAPTDAVIGLVADHATTADLVGREEIGYVAFTGSVEGGFEVSRAAAGRPIDVGLELGGKDPAYVRADADLAFAAANVAEGAFYNAGQSCCAVERAYVDRKVYPQFLDLVVEATQRWVPADPLDERSTCGPMAQASGIATVEGHVADALEKGARLLTGGSRASVGDKGRYYQPTVLAETTHRMAVMVEETFGPVLPVAPVDGDDEAIERMNDSRYGLTASIWSRDVATARRLGPRLQAGTVFLNRCDYLDPALPWSGWKDSGVGITLSRFGFDRMVRTRGLHFRLPA